MKHPLFFFQSFRRLAPVLMIALTASAADSGRQTEMEAVVRDYLLQHPEIVVQALQKFQSVQKAES
jgi:hypothetical protein